MSDWAQKAEDQEISRLVNNLEIKKDEKDTLVERADVASAAETSLLLKIIRKGLVESNLDLEVQRKDPKSPLHSVKTFEALHL
ncbi:PREDICTED: DEAD-box helicase Dbp80-like [Rhagoletis zephyria]|nr:PREDICTED: DEAD-box helicase Dbp80-like [Rhagoletis zephyria]